MKTKSVLAGVLLVCLAVLVAGCSTPRGCYNCAPNISTAGAVLGGALIGGGLLASGYFNGQTEQKRVDAYAALNARCALGGNGTATAGAYDVHVSGTTAGTNGCPTGVMPYPEHGNTALFQVAQPQVVAQGQAQPYSGRVSSDHYGYVSPCPGGTLTKFGDPYGPCYPR